MDKRSNKNSDKEAKQKQKQKTANLIRSTRHGKAISTMYYLCRICTRISLCEPTINMQTNYTVEHWIMNLFPRKKTIETDSETTGFIT